MPALITFLLALFILAAVFAFAAIMAGAAEDANEARRVEREWLEE